MAPTTGTLPHTPGSSVASPRPTLAPGSGPKQPSIAPGGASCPWLRSVTSDHVHASSLARHLVGMMTLDEKLGEIVLTSRNGYENANTGVPRLCIPALTLQDGPQGLAFGDTNVTQLPAPLGIAASFDPSLARSYGKVEGSEAYGQGVDVVQGPNLNVDRVPQNGRGYETFGEDPLLVTDLGVANIEGIQSQHVLAQAKHFAAYSQETNRGIVDEVVPARALHEVYLPPFKAAVQQAHVGSVMCAYPRLNGTFQCEDPALDSLLRSWGFAGIVRSDLGAVHDSTAAVSAGTVLIKPERMGRLADSVSDGATSLHTVDASVIRILTTMIARGLMRPTTGAIGDLVTTRAHAAFALSAAEQSMVLLRNRGGVLPLTTSRDHAIAVIGAAASSAPVTTGFGSSRVLAPFTSTALAAIEREVGKRSTVTYSDGGSTTRPLPDIPAQYLVPASGSGHGLALTVSHDDAPAGSAPIRATVSGVDTLLHLNPTTISMAPGTGVGPTPPVDRPDEGPASPHRAPADTLRLPAGWTSVTATWTGTLTPPRSGPYSLSLSGSGGAVLTLDGKAAVADTLSHGLGTWSQTVPLVAGHPYQVKLTWDPFDALTADGHESLRPSRLQLGWQFVGDDVAAAVAAAKSAQVAVVFAGDFSAEGFDRPSLSLPGDEDELIAAVAAANPRTVVVLDTGGPVTMPWLPSVAGVLEAWYPGEQAGTAAANVLFGAVDPAGHLPVTFPTSSAASAVATPSQWPGVDLTATYAEGLEVGYRYDHAHHVAPLFPFGFGLSYTNFAVHHLSVSRTAGGEHLTVDVTNLGSRRGTAVPQAYLTYPRAAAEPPGQLKAFTTVSLAPHQTRTVSLSVPWSALRSYLGGRWTTVPGTYHLGVGQSSARLVLHAEVRIGSGAR